MAIAKVHWEKVAKNGKRYFRITKLEGFKKLEDLPEEYVSKSPFMILHEGVLWTEVQIYLPQGHDDVSLALPVGVRLLTEAQMEQALKWMRICGSRLTGINKSLSKRNADWHGEGVTEI